MTNCKEESLDQNPQECAGRMNYAPSTQRPILAPTLQRRVKPRIVIKLGCKQFDYTRWLYKQYGLKTPGWLRRTFILNQYRRKSLNDNLREAQLDEVYCDKYAGTDEWCDQLHSVWHEINGGSSCK
jgi:hypothetical protein